MYVCTKYCTTCVFAKDCVCTDDVLGLKRASTSEVLASPALKRRRVQFGEGESEREREDTPSDSQLDLFDGLSFLLTMKNKEDKYLGMKKFSFYFLLLLSLSLSLSLSCSTHTYIATPPNEQIDKEHVASQIRSRMGCILDSADQRVSPCSIPLVCI